MCGRTQLYTTPGKKTTNITHLCWFRPLSFSHSASQQVCLEKILLGTWKMKATIAGLSLSLTHTHTHLNWQGRGSAAQKRLSKHCPRQSRIAHTLTDIQTQRAVSDAGISHPPGKYKRLVMLYRRPQASDSTHILIHDNLWNNLYVQLFFKTLKKGLIHYENICLITGTAGRY